MKARFLPALAALGSLSWISPTSAQPRIVAQAARERAEGVHRFSLGDIAATVVSDGYQSDVPNDNSFIGANTDPQSVARELRRAGLPTDHLSFDFNALVLRIGERLVLVDTGFGAGVPFAGKLASNLRRAGVSPSQITDVVITHAHPDHIGGVVTTDGRLIYPRARHWMSYAEWTYLNGLRGPEVKNAPRQIAALRPRLRRFNPGSTLAPGLVTLAAPGHTPGQVALLLGSGARRALYISDTAHHYAVSLRRPEWTVGSDFDKPLATRTRRALLSRAAREKWLVVGYHFPFPGLGRVRQSGSRFAWNPIVAARAAR